MRKISYRKIRTIDYDKFWRDLQNSRLMSDPSNLNLSDLVYLYNGTLKSLFDTHAPVISKIVINRPSSLWYTDEIRSEKRKCRALERRWRSSRSVLDPQHSKDQGSIVNNMIRSAKVDYYSDLIRENYCDQKILFAAVNMLLHRKPTIDYPRSRSSDSELANKFVEFFSNKIVVLRASLQVKSGTDIQVIAADAIPCLFNLSHFNQVTSSDVLKLIGTSVIKSCPLDPVPASVFKQCISVLVPAIVNKSICSGVVPDCFKLTLLKPLLKKIHLDSEGYANFRPVSNLMYISKLTEKVVAKQLIEYISSNGLDVIFQSAYIKFS